MTEVLFAHKKVFFSFSFFFSYAVHRSAALPITGGSSNGAAHRGAPRLPAVSAAPGGRIAPRTAVPARRAQVGEILSAPRTSQHVVEQHTLLFERSYSNGGNS